MNEALFSSALACMVFSLIGAQPLTVVGITGLISLFNYTIFDIIKRYDVSLYPQFISWVAIWAAMFHWIFALLNFCDYMRAVTDFTSQSFGAYVGIVYCIKGVELLIGEFETYGPRIGYMDVVIALLFFFTVYMLELVRGSVLFTPGIRVLLGDYAYPVRNPFNLFWIHTLSISSYPRSFGLASPTFQANSVRPMSPNYPTHAPSTPPSTGAGWSIFGSLRRSGYSWRCPSDF